MIYLMDTNVVSALVQENQHAVSKTRSLPLLDEAVICTIVRGECLFGVERLPAGKRRDALKIKMDNVLGK